MTTTRRGVAWNGHARRCKARFFSPKGDDEMALERFTFTVTGESPILMNNPAGMKKPGEDGGAKIKKIPTPEEEAKSLVYRDPEGRIFGPAMGFKSALISAAKGRKFGKVAAGSVIRGNVFCPLDAERVYLRNPKTGKPLTDKDYTIDSRRCVLSNGAKKVGVVRSRPRFEAWSCDVVLEIDTEAVESKAIENLFVIAGHTIGYLDFRPEKGGSFGRFTVAVKK